MIEGAGRLGRRAAGVVKDMAATRRHKPDYQIALYMGLLMMLGLIIMYAIGPQRAQDGETKPGKKQVPLHKGDRAEHAIANSKQAAG